LPPKTVLTSLQTNRKKIKMESKITHGRKAILKKYAKGCERMKLGGGDKSLGNEKASTTELF